MRAAGIRRDGLPGRGGPPGAAPGRVSLTSLPRAPSIGEAPSPLPAGQAHGRPHSKQRRKLLRLEREKTILYPNKQPGGSQSHQTKPQIRITRAWPGSRALSLKHLPGSCPGAALSSPQPLCWTSNGPAVGIRASANSSVTVEVAGSLNGVRWGEIGDSLGSVMCQGDHDGEMRPFTQSLVVPDKRKVASVSSQSAPDTALSTLKQGIGASTKIPDFKTGSACPFPTTAFAEGWQSVCGESPLGCQPAGVLERNV